MALEEEKCESLSLSHVVCLAGLLTLVETTPTLMSHLTFVKFKIGGCVNRAAEIGTSGVLCAVTEVMPTVAVGWSEIPLILCVKFKTCSVPGRL